MIYPLIMEDKQQTKEKAMNEKSKMLAGLVLFFLVGCQPPTCPVWGYSYAKQSDYRIAFDASTPAGFLVDTSGQQVDLERIDFLVQSVKDCLAAEFPEGRISQKDRTSGQCIYDSIFWDRPAECVSFKVVSDWVWSCDGKWQLLGESASAPQHLCNQKGFSPDANCPCRWRAGLQDGVIVVTPDLRMLADPLIRLLTGCNVPWAVMGLAKCANISTGE